MNSFIHYLPDISSISGIIFYSFIAYIIIYTISGIMTYLVEDYFDHDKRFTRRLIKARERKTKEADKLIKKINHSTK